MAGAATAAFDEYELKGTFGPDGSESTGFSSARSIAVDQQADVVYVIDGEGSLYKFDLGGNPISFSGSAAYISGNKIGGLTYFGGEGNSQVAADSSSHEFYVTSANSVTAFQANGEPALFSAGSGAGTNTIGGFTRLIGLAVDANGAIYAADRDAGVVRIFAPSGEQITQFAAAEAGNLAVDSSGAVYVNRRFNVETVLKFTPSTFPVTAATTYTAAPQPLSPKGSYTVAVDRSTDEVYTAQNVLDPRIVVYDEDGDVLISFAGPGEDGAITRSLGVAVDEDTGEAFVSDIPSSGLSQVKVFGGKSFPEEPPTIELTSVTGVSADSATFLARINPNTAATTYYFEYGLDDCAVNACARLPLDGEGIGAGHEPVAVSQHVSGLQAGTTYYYRVVADNTVVGDEKFGVREGPGRTFTTQISGLAFQLPDRRVWEMVSPPDKNGALIGAGLKSGQVQAAVDGDGLAYLTGGSIETEPEGRRDASAVLAHRGAGGWASEDITPPNSQVAPPALGAQSEYKLFDPDLSEALLEPRSETALSPEASGPTPYWRQNTQPPFYRPLLTDKEGFANVPPGTATGAAEIRAATPDLDHVVLGSTAPLVAGASSGAVYKWFEGDVEPVSVLPAAEGGAVVAADVGSGGNSVRHAISDDGSRVFWTAASSQGLYVRDMVEEESSRIDVVQPGAGGAGVADPVFQGASADGAVVFFTDTHQLTDDASPSGADLYRCELPLSAPLGDCAGLINLSAPLLGSGESAEVLGMVSALGDDGTRPYFVARGVLDTEANELGDSAVAGEPNLYLWQDGEGVRFIATLSAEDDADWGMPGTVPAPGRVASTSAASSPSGRYFAFMSERSLTGEDNLDAATGAPAERVFRYDAASDHLDCVSCDPTGAAPTAQVLPTATESGQVGPLIDPRNQWEGRLAAAVLPEPTILTIEGTSLYRPRAVLDSGRVFFNAVDSLVPADSNDQWDVYQYEPTGVGACSASSGDAGTSRSGDGCISLLSSGTADGPVGFFDAGVSGDDVFFRTPAKLSVTDEDEEPDIYDARVDGVAATLQPRTECLGEACQPSPLVPNDPIPGSATFQGAGNLSPHAGKRCPKGKRKVRRGGRLRCVPRKHKKSQRRHGAGQSRRAGR